MIDLDLLATFFLGVTRHIGDNILVPNQDMVAIALDRSKPVPPGADAHAAQAHCELDDIAQEYFLNQVIRQIPGARSMRLIVEEDTPTVEAFASCSNEVLYGDLLDGTSRYGYRGKDEAEQRKRFGCQVSYAADAQMRAAAVYLPRLGLQFHAVYNRGAYLNGERLILADAPVSGKFMVNSKLPDEAVRRLEQDQIDVERPKCTVYAVSQLLLGKVDAYISKHTAVWDIAPFSLIVEEAGAWQSRWNLSKPDLNTKDLVEDHIIACSRGYAVDALVRAGLTHSGPR